MKVSGEDKEISVKEGLQKRKDQRLSVKRSLKARETVPASVFAGFKKGKLESKKRRKDQRLPVKRSVKNKETKRAQKEIVEEQGVLTKKSRSRPKNSKVDCKPSKDELEKDTLSTFTRRNSDALKKGKRKPCFYGSSCYRKNPMHKKVVAHPGDSDYEEEIEEALPDHIQLECEFGRHCYGKYLQHVRDYKHTVGFKAHDSLDSDEEELILREFNSKSSF